MILKIVIRKDEYEEFEQLRGELSRTEFFRRLIDTYKADQSIDLNVLGDDLEPYHIDRLVLNHRNTVLGKEKERCGRE